jgi:hypothetical protein
MSASTTNLVVQSAAVTFELHHREPLYALGDALNLQSTCHGTKPLPIVCATLHFH